MFRIKLSASTVSVMKERTLSPFAHLENSVMEKVGHRVRQAHTALLKATSPMMMISLKLSKSVNQDFTATKLAFIRSHAHSAIITIKEAAKVTLIVLNVTKTVITVTTVTKLVRLSSKIYAVMDTIAQKVQTASPTLLPVKRDLHVVEVCPLNVAKDPTKTKVDYSKTA